MVTTVRITIPASMFPNGTAQFALPGLERVFACSEDGGFDLSLTSCVRTIWIFSLAIMAASEIFLNCCCCRRWPCIEFHTMQSVGQQLWEFAQIIIICRDFSAQPHWAVAFRLLSLTSPVRAAVGWGEEKFELIPQHNEAPQQHEGRTSAVYLPSISSWTEVEQENCLTCAPLSRLFIAQQNHFQWEIYQ